MNSSSILAKAENFEIDFQRLGNPEATFLPIKEITSTSHVEITTQGFLILNPEEKVLQKCHDGTSKF